MDALPNDEKLLAGSKAAEGVEWCNRIFMREREYHGIGTIDFNKIIPMPESLDIESGTRTDHGIELCLTAANPLVNYFGEKKMSPDDFTALLARANRGKMIGSYRSSLSKEEIERITEHDSAESLMKVGSQALQNVVLFGSPDWYDWRCRNWGTKWNAYDIAAFDEDSDTITFETAWSAPHPILEKISQMFPEVCIEDFNGLLEELGPDAVENATLYEDEDFDLS